MNPSVPVAECDRQLPLGEEIFLDHVGHFVADAEAARRALAGAGFTPTPLSVQVDPATGGPTGTGNVTAVLRRGYMEVLFRTADTALGRELGQALARFAGVHLVAFAVDEAAAAHRRVAAAGFRVRPLAEMQRPSDTVDGPDIAAFSIVRVESGEMAEGRIQILRHRTEHTVWQPRWLDQPNGAESLVELLLVTDDVAATAARYAAFLGRPAAANAAGAVVRLDRGRVQIMTRRLARPCRGGARCRRRRPDPARRHDRGAVPGPARHRRLGDGGRPGRSALAPLRPPGGET
jgi:hypothetical protein